MSNLLNEAIIDAKALREAALKNAETIVIEKYSNDVKKTLEKLLEQEDDLDAMLGGADPAADPAAEDPAAAVPTELTADPALEEEAEPHEDISEDEFPLAATDDFSELDGKNLNSFLESGQETEISIDLGALQENLDALSSEIEEANLEEDEEIDFNAMSLDEMLSDDEDDGASAEAAETEAAADEDAEASMEEDVDFDALADAIMEKLTVDMGADLSGWAGRSSGDKKYQIEKELAHRRSTDVQEELEALKKAQEELVFENNQINGQNNEYKQAFQELKENLQDVNLSNARLLYTNRVLRNTSLNERQKDKIAEAISSAGSVTEARTIFETLQSTVEGSSKKTKSPKSLSEAIGRRSTVLRATRQETPAFDPLQDRMKKLAGIK